MTIQQYSYAGAAVILAFWLGYKIGDFRGRRRLGEILRKAGSSLAERV